MDVRIIKETRNELELEIIGEDHTLCNVLQHVLNARKEVISAAYKIEHPLLSSPRIYIKTREDVLLPKGMERLLPLTEIKGVGEKKAEQIRKAGVKTANAFLKADLDKLAEKTGISKTVLEKYLEEANKLDFQKESVARYVLKQALKDLAAEFSGLRAK